MISETEAVLHAHLTEAEDSRDEWKLRAERAEQERGEISEQLAKMDAKWRHAYNRLADYEDHGTTDQFSRLRRRAEKSEAERDDYRDLLVEALDEYADHQSWRCGHPPHFYYVDADAAAQLVADGDCPCGLDGFCKRARAVLAGDHDQGAQT